MRGGPAVFLELYTLYPHESCECKCRKSTINNLNALNCKIYRTDKNGEITITSNGENIKIEKFIND